MKLPSLNEFSLWLEPEGKDLIRIKKFTTEIQKISGSPKFIPHVTLLGGLKATKKEIESNLKKLSKNKTFKLEFKKISKGKKDLKSFFLECNTSSELVKLNKLTQKIYSTNKDFLPHMSLCYGKLSTEISATLTEKVERKKLGFFSFKVRKISLWHAKGKVEEWKKIKEIFLN